MTGQLETEKGVSWVPFMQDSVYGRTAINVSTGEVTVSIDVTYRDASGNIGYSSGYKSGKKDVSITVSVPYLCTGVSAESEHTASDDNYGACGGSLSETF